MKCPKYLLFFSIFILTAVILSSNARAVSPRIVSSNPSNGETNVPLNLGIIELDFNEPIVINYWDNISFYTSDGLITNDVVNFYGDRNAAWAVLDDSDLSPNTQYVLKVWGFSDSSGNKMEDYTLSFTTGNSSYSPVPALVPKGAVNVTWIGVTIVILIILGASAGFLLIAKKKESQKEEEEMERALTEIKSAMVAGEKEKARELYKNLQSEFNKLPDESKEDYYGKIQEMYSKLSAM